jgi:hypothetical protein
MPPGVVPGDRYHGLSRLRLTTAWAKDALITTSVSEVRTKRQQSVELGGIITGTVGAGDEDLPALFRKSPPLGDGDDNTQPDRRGGILTF